MVVFRTLGEPEGYISIRGQTNDRLHDTPEYRGRSRSPCDPTRQSLDVQPISSENLPWNNCMLESIQYRASQHEQELRVAPTRSLRLEACEVTSQRVACSGRSRAFRAALVASFKPVIEHFRPKRVHRTYVNEMWSRMRKINQGVAVVRKEIQAHQPKNARSGQIWSGTEGGIPYGRQLGCQRSGSRPPLVLKAAVIHTNVVVQF